MAARVLATQARWFANWPDVFSRYRKRQRLPQLKLRNGILLQHRENDDAWALFMEIFLDRCYTKPDFYVPRAGDRVLDIGANIGFFALYLQSVAPGIRVHCFEPSSTNRRQLETNLKSNGLQDRVSVHPFAILNRDGTETLAQGAQAGDTSFFKQGEAASTETVRCVRLDQAIDLCGGEVDLMKLDVEGAEVEIFEGASDSVWPRIRRIAMEYHEEIRPGSRDRIVALLKSKYRFVRSRSTTPTGALGIIEASNAGS